MYTQTPEERQRLNRIMATYLLPALQRAILEASQSLVYETEGFHPDMAYSAVQRTVADEITMRLCQYLAGCSYRTQEGMFEKLTSDDMYRWLKESTSEFKKVSID